jgi:D-tyrosyl-tRNA(Tyr) deacylase
LRALLQRVSRAEVRVDGESLGAIEGGLLILLGVAPGDDDAVAAGLAAKILSLRIFADELGLTNRSIGDVGGAVLVVSQFTLFADTRKGRRPSFVGAAGPELGERLYDLFCESLAASGVPVERGRFGADMDVELVNAGPFTIWLDTADLGIAARPGS